MILTTNKLSAASVNNHPELDPNTFSLLLSTDNNGLQLCLIQEINIIYWYMQQMLSNIRRDASAEQTDVL